MSEPDRTYYASCAVKARALAFAATDAGIRAIHAEMTGRYELLAAGDAEESAEGQRTSQLDESYSAARTLRASRHSAQLDQNEQVSRMSGK